MATAKTTKPQTLYQKMMAVSNNKFASVAKDGIIGDIYGFCDSGSYIFNALISGKLKDGGYARGKVTCLAGEPGTGKTYLLLKAMKLFLDENPTGAIFLFESESAITKKMMVERGIDVNRVVVLPVNTIEEMRNQAVAILNHYNDDCDAAKKAHDKTQVKKKKKIEWVNPSPIFIACDSIGNLSTHAEVTNAIEGKTTKTMSREAVLKGATRLITTRLARYQIPMILTAHTYMTMDKWSKTVMGGGSGPKYTASIIVFLFKFGIKDDDKNLIGNNIRCIQDKGRLTKEKLRCLTQIMFTTGLNRYYGLLAPGIAAGIIEQSGAWYKFPNGKKYQGEAHVYASAATAFDDTFLDALQPWITENFCYGKYEEVPEDTVMTDTTEDESIEDVIIDDDSPESKIEGI